MLNKTFSRLVIGGSFLAVGGCSTVGVGGHHHDDSKTQAAQPRVEQGQIGSDCFYEFNRRSALLTVTINCTGAEALVPQKKYPEVGTTVFRARVGNRWLRQDKLLPVDGKDLHLHPHRHELPKNRNNHELENRIGRKSETDCGHTHIHYQTDSHEKTVGCNHFGLD